MRLSESLDHSFGSLQGAMSLRERRFVIRCRLIPKLTVSTGTAPRRWAGAKRQGDELRPVVAAQEDRRSIFGVDLRQHPDDVGGAEGPGLSDGQAPRVYLSTIVRQRSLRPSTVESSRKS